MKMETLTKLEKSIDERLRLLSALTPVAPRPDCLDRVKANVAREAEQLDRHRRFPGHWARWGAVAAAVVAVLCLRTAPTPLGGGGLEERGDATQRLSEWVSAVDQASERASRLLDDSAVPPGVDTPVDESDLDALLESIDQSLGLGA